ncbi:MAG: hydroxysqualene dehydroxylase HpnE [Melioribacteraceae bacterium]|nr:hydroxysqualene dehydroxylase HpnE [Melioribacteraceae bacterium]
MKKVLIIGGGLAGLSTAVFLADKNFKIKLIEASPKLGGRTYSFSYTKRNREIDNGQHILMGCYNETFKYIDLIGSKDTLDFQPSLKVNYVSVGGKDHELKAFKNLYPLNLLYAFLRFDVLKLTDRVNIIKLLISIKLGNQTKTEHQSVRDWLENNKQTNESIDKFWRILVVGTLNTTIDSASALIFIDIIRKMFFNGNSAATIVLPNKGLSSVFVEPAVKYIREREGEIYLSEKVIDFVSENKCLTEVITNKNHRTDFDLVVSAIPFFSMQKIFSSKIIEQNFNLNFKYSPILSIHIWLRKNFLTEKFYGLINSKIDWVFNHREHITLVKSSADELINLSNNDLIRITDSELKKYFPIFNQRDILDYKIIKEKRATFIPTDEVVSSRKTIISPFTNLILAGDWTNTGLPATIEGAIKSGSLASENLLSRE